jgi:hypothetical protein
MVTSLLSVHSGQHSEKPGSDGAYKITRTTMVEVLGLCIVLLTTGADLLEHVGILVVGIHDVEIMSCCVECKQT